MRIFIFLYILLFSLSPSFGESDALRKAVWHAMKAAKESDAFIEERRDREFEDGYVLPLLFCPKKDHECRMYQAGLIVDAEYSYKGDYYAQRNFASCLSSGCGLMQKQPVLSCAWHIVILASGSPLVTKTDVNNFRKCFAKLDEIERATAGRQAANLFRRVYDEELPPEWR